MAKTKTKSRSGSKDILRSANAPLIKSGLPRRSTEELLTEATELLESLQPERAQALAEEALTRLQNRPEDYVDSDVLLRLAAQEKATYPTALVLNADIALALSQTQKAQMFYIAATRIDPDGQLVSAEPWLQLAQLCEEGGKRSIEYYDKAIEIMQNELELLSASDGVVDDTTRDFMHLRQQRVAEALCSEAEVYMTDLSWEEDAEDRCERLVTEAVAVCPDSLSAGVLQTLANVRISQSRIDEARRILEHSISIWSTLPAGIESPARPDFATRVSLSRLLMEVEQELDASMVLEGLVKEDDQSVEAWYLGGWCQVLLGQKKDRRGSDERMTNVEQARVWLGQCLKLYEQQEYEDDRLHEHTLQLMKQLDAAAPTNGDENEEWEDEEDKDDPADDDAEIEVQDDTEDIEMTQA